MVGSEEYIQFCYEYETNNPLKIDIVQNKSY